MALTVESRSGGGILLFLPLHQDGFPQVVKVFYSLVLLSENQRSTEKPPAPKLPSTCSACERLFGVWAFGALEPPPGEQAWPTL